MLHENARQRLFRMVPETYDLEWYDPTRDAVVAKSVQLGPRQRRWADEDSPAKYPTVALQLNNVGERRGAFDELFEDDILKQEVADPEVAYTKYIAAPLRADLTVTIAAKKDEGPIPKKVVADSIAMDVWHEFNYENGHLESQGVDGDGEPIPYAWPMRVRDTNSAAIVDTSRVLDEQAVQRRQFQFVIDYFYWSEEEVPATARIEWDLHVDLDRDGAFDSEYGPFVIETEVEADDG